MTETRKRNDKRSGRHTPRPPGHRYPSEIEQKNSNAAARLIRYAADMDMTPTAFLRRYGSTSSRPPRRNGKAPSLDC